MRDFSPADAGKTLGVNRVTVWRWIKSGKVKANRTPGGTHRIPQSEVERLRKEMGG
jgi:putative resolvase